jgi:hypothetical protein
VLAQQCGFHLVDDDDTGTVALVPSRDAAT